MLLATAKSQPLPVLRKKAAESRAKGEDSEARARRLYLRVACGHSHDLKTLDELRWAGPPGEGYFVDKHGNPWRAPPDAAGTDRPADYEAARPDGPDDPSLFTLAD